LIYTDLKELKKILEIEAENTQEDVKLNFFVEYASDIIQTFLNRPDLSLQERSEIYRGTGTQTLLLRCRPVFTTPIPIVYIDENAAFGAAPDAYNANTQLHWGTDFTLSIDQANGSSRSATLIRLHDVWPRPTVRQTGWLNPFAGKDPGSIKVVYTAGYTVDTLPAGIRYACNLLVAKMRSLFPVGMEVGAESFQDRSMSFVVSQREYLMSLAKPHLLPYRNWKW
jgi:hypothetical protein